MVSNASNPRMPERLLFRRFQQTLISCLSWLKPTINRFLPTFAQHANVQLTSGQICYEAVAAEEPAGKHIALAKKVSCRLKLNDIDTDLEVLADYGLAGLRRHRILRLTQEAYDQDALLSYEDLAVLLTSSPATMKRDIRALKQDGYFVMTRGAKHDMGPGLSHKDADP